MSATESARAGEHICPECAEEGVATSYTRADNLANHREKEHGVPKPTRRERRETAGSGRGASDGPKLQRDLAQAHLGISILVVTTTNPAVLGNTAAVDLLEKQSRKWAGDAYALARQDARIMKAIESAMRAGVFAAFCASTAGSLITVAAMTGKVAVPYGAAVFLVPDLAQMMTAAPPPAAPAHGAGMNGDGPPQAEL